ncbi:MAG: tetratricopeptide repeat protein [Geitlerinemataceae cyanobacterium]
MKLSRIDELGDKYPVLLRSLRRRQGFGIAFVECSLAQATELSRRLPEDLPTKHIETLELNEPIDELYPVVAALPNPGKIDILLVVGLEKSVVPYIREGETGYGGVGGYYQRDTVPRIMGHLNMQRERFRDDFDICFVFLLPRFALNYVRHRAADFFDWRSGVYAMQRDEASLAQESSRLLEDTDWDTYRSLTPVQRQERLLEIGDLIDAPLTGERKAQLWREKGRLLAVEEEYEEAIASYDKAVEFKPDLHEAWNNRGVALGNLGRNEEAIASFDKAVEFKPDLHQAWVNRGVALRNLGRYEEAIASWDKAVEFKPDLHQAWVNRGNALDDLGRYEEAVASYDKAVEFKPDYHEAWYNRGYALFNLGRYEEAIASYDKAIETQPNDDETWYNRGYALFTLKRTEEALASYHRAIELNPNNANAWYNTACLYAMQQNLDAAITHLQKAIDLDPEYRNMAKTDTDFDCIRNCDRFLKLLDEDADG